MATQHQSRGTADGMSTGQLAVIGGAVLALVGIVLPWATISILGQSESANGIDLVTSDTGSVLFSGGVTGALALVAGAMAAFGNWGSTAQSGSLALGFIIAAVGVVHVVAPGTAIGLSGQQAQMASQLIETGIGVYATILGGIAILAGGVLGRQS